MSAALDYDRERAELLAEALGDFQLFASLLEITPKEGIGRIPLRLTRIQSVFSIERTGRDLVLKARQIGMTTLELARDLFHWLTVPGASVLIICQSMTGDAPMNEIAARITDYLESLERAGLQLEYLKKREHDWHIIGAGGARAKLSIKSAGASEASAKKLGRSGTVTRLHCTETSVWEYATLSMNAVLECVPHRRSGSEIVIESTAHGAAGFFYDYCIGADKVGYRLHFYPWFDHEEYATPLDDGEVIEPKSDRERFLVEECGITSEQLKWYQQKLAEKNGNQDLMDQEYPSDPNTCFLVSGRQFFSQQVTDRLTQLATTRQPIEVRDHDRIRIYERPRDDRSYVMGVDTSSGGGLDPSAAVLYERESGKHVATVDGQYTPLELARVIAALGIEYNEALIAVERENHGAAVLLELEVHLDYPNLYIHFDDQKPGHPTNAVTRPIILDGLDDVHRRGLWSSSDVALLEQMRVFVIGADGKPQAQSGKHDDLVFAAAIGWRVRCLPVQDLSVGGISNQSRYRGGTVGHQL